MPKKNNRTLNKSIDILRIVIISVLFCTAILLFVFKLFELQVVKHDKYAEESIPKIEKTRTLEISRGHIYDRNGVVLASNVKSYNVVIDKAFLVDNDYNTPLLYFIKLCSENGIELVDKLPVSKQYPYVLDENYIFDEEKDKLLNRFVSDFELEDENLLEYNDNLYRYLCKRYNIPENLSNLPEYRKLVGIRYDMETNSIEYFKKYTLLSDIDERTRVVVSESLHEMHGITITSTDKRYYNKDSLAAHLIGRVGKIDSSDVDEYVTEKGYSYDEIIGVAGAERAFEEYLHGYDGSKKYFLDEEGNVIGVENGTEYVNGYSVKLTLDSEMQKVAEESLDREIKTAQSRGMNDCRAGSVVVMNPKTGEVLVCASLPSYNPNTYSQDIAILNQDPASPQLNRATEGTYPPGSTFKIATAIAALSEGVITPNIWINDTGRYTAYEDYQPACWSLTKRGYGHGWVDLRTAIEESCNYYFYKIADDMGIDGLTKHASKLGLGEKTGVEIPEKEGVLAGPESRDRINGGLWNPGDTLQAAIGQSDNTFTPIQLCSYLCTVVNGGTRYKATILDSVVNYYTDEVVFENTPEVLETIELPSDTVAILKSAMKSVVDEGTASSVFINYEHEIGGKTGTAQVGVGHDTVLFVGFAPYDDPEIVVSVVVEHGDDSSRATYVAKDIFDYYFMSLEDEKNGKDADED